MSRAQWLQTAGSLTLRYISEFARSNRFYRFVAGKLTSAKAAPSAARTEAPSVGAQLQTLSDVDELAANQEKFPFPQWALEGSLARGWILADVPRGGVGAEVGVFRGHFSEVILGALTPRKFYMIDPWTTLGEFFSWASEYTNHGKLPTALARREAQLRAGKFPNIETVIVEGKFPDCMPQIGEQLDWIYIDSSHRYEETLLELKAAARILKRDGLILGDDFYPDRSSIHHGVFRAVNEFVKIEPYEFVAAGPKGQWCLRRTDVASVAVKGKLSIAEELAFNQTQFPFPQRILDEFRAPKSFFESVPTRAVGAEVGAFRGHFSEVLLARRAPRKFFMIDAWTRTGEFFPRANEYSNNGKLPTKLARREAKLRVAKFPNTETVVVDDDFPHWAAAVAEEPLDWVYLHSNRNYKQSLLHLVMAARILKSGGIIMGDDYYPGTSYWHNGVFRAISEFVDAAPFKLIAAGPAGQWCLRHSVRN